ncbi:hypothetical protein D9757_008423 [Collybiopsis confluens]|uniref:Uncharacterized protein n=1 Tax=Collybiopsis confluens TaxID=2823264 RepID=A0A8H5M7A1_9AGAR|nr:hypothetical protein D9757_008423 [Collybiopsis confluens]
MATLTELNGTAVPHCYGFFTAKLPECYWTSSDDNDVSGYDYLGDNDHSSHPKYPWMFRSYDENRDCDDTLDDDRQFAPLGEPEGETRRFKDQSRWNKWIPDPNNPLIAALVMDKGGPAYTLEDEQDRDVRWDIELLLQDFQLAGIGRGDFRMSNLVRAPPQTTMCSYHKVVHQWNVIDFNRSWVVDLKREKRVNYAVALLKPMYRFYFHN